MNKVILVGRLTRDPEVRYSQGNNPTAVARYTLAVNRAFSREGEPDADFINCVAFGKKAEFAEKYFRQGIRVAISGRIQTGSYTNREGVKVYTTDIIIEDHEFAQSKNEGSSDNIQQKPQLSQNQQPNVPPSSADGFMNIPDGLDEELPFS